MRIYPGMPSADLKKCTKNELLDYLAESFGDMADGKRAWEDGRYERMKKAEILDLFPEILELS